MCETPYLSNIYLPTDIVHISCSKCLISFGIDKNIKMHYAKYYYEEMQIYVNYDVNKSIIYYLINNKEYAINETFPVMDRIKLYDKVEKLMAFI